MAAFAVKFHPILPVFLWIAKTSPNWPPTISQSPATAGLLLTMVASGKAKAHFNFSVATLFRLTPACRDDRKPVPCQSFPHPEQSKTEGSALGIEKEVYDFWGNV